MKKFIVTYLDGSPIGDNYFTNDLIKADDFFINDTGDLIFINETGKSPDTFAVGVWKRVKEIIKEKND